MKGYSSSQFSFQRPRNLTDGQRPSGWQQPIPPCELTVILRTRHHHNRHYKSGVTIHKPISFTLNVKSTFDDSCPLEASYDEGVWFRSIYANYLTSFDGKVVQRVHRRFRFVFVSKKWTIFEQEEVPGSPIPNVLAYRTSTPININRDTNYILT